LSNSVIVLASFYGDGLGIQGAVLRDTFDTLLSSFLRRPSGLSTPGTDLENKVLRSGLPFTDPLDWRQQAESLIERVADALSPRWKSPYQS
jgi:hypothetical protein